MNGGGSTPSLAALFQACFTAVFPLFQQSFDRASLAFG
jgi:hypothetical protein